MLSFLCALCGLCGKKSSPKHLLSRIFGSYVTLLTELNGQGYAIVPAVYTPVEIERIAATIHNAHGDATLFGTRQFLQRTPGLTQLLLNDSLRKILDEVLPGCFIIKSIYFDKPAQANWFVSWHRDQVIFVKEKVETFGFKNWTKKENEYGVQPPAEYLGNIVTVRIHLDDTGAENGALKVIPYSHSEASLRSTGVSFSDSDATLCPVPAGGVMLMKPLLFHSSARSNSEKQRRVIHLEFCNMELVEGLEWAQKTMCR